MFSKKKNEAPAPPRRKGAELMSQMGLGGMEDIESQLYGDVENDEDLEAELLELQGKPRPKKSRARGPVGASDFDKMIAESMKDLDDEEISDTEDPDLLDELSELQDDGDSQESTPSSPSKGVSAGGQVGVLEDRLQNYQEAANGAKAAGDSSKQRRMERGAKTIQDLLKKARQGKSIDEDDIPPPVAVSSAKAAAAPRPAPQQPPAPVFEPTISENRPAPAPAPAPRKAAPPPPTQAPIAQPTSSSTANSGVAAGQTSEKAMLMERRDQYKRAALAAKHGGDSSSALKYVKISKQFDKVLEALDAGNPVDLSQMPPPPPGVTASTSHVAAAPKPAPRAVETDALQRGGERDRPSPAAPAPPSEDDERSLFQAPNAPKTVMAALLQRLDKYKNAELQAKEEGNNSKSRRMGRITKQYQDAIKAVKAGKPVDFDELPTPPGYAPIPVETLSQSTPSSGPSPSHSASSLQPSPGRAPSHPQPGQRSPQPAQRQPQQQRSPAPAPAKPAQQESADQRSPMKRGLSMRADQQAQFLRERMQEYKMAAITAKKNNDIALAKQYLRMAKGFEPMIEASESGLPVDMTQLPPPLDKEEDNPNFVMVSKEECELSGDRSEVFKKLEQDLIAQIRTCTTNSSHFSKLGDVISANKFQKMESGLRKDLDALKNAFRHNDPVPKFHYENRTFSIVQCNTDLGDNDLEMSIVRGVQYNLPSGYSEKDLDTYIKYEFPFPNDEPQLGQTETVKGSFNPEYQSSHKITLNRKSRALVRVIERKTVKCEVFYKRGFLKSDKLLGTVNVKLLPLETQCTVHDSYDLTDGRKSVGGKLEVKLRIRDPFKSKQVEEVKEKWLVIDQFIKTMAKSTVTPQGGDKKSPTAGSTCMEVLKFEKQQLDKQIISLRESLSPTQLSTLTAKSKQLQERINDQQEKLRSGGNAAWKDYVQIVTADIEAYTQDAKQYAQHSDMQKAQLMLTKKKLAEKEVAAIRSKLNI